ncbi:hypothetical protein C3L33_00276, partial [Rhododendron williamsianum]
MLWGQTAVPWNSGGCIKLMNPKNTISQVKRLIGRQFSDPELQRDIKTLPFAVTEGSDGYPLIHARYLGESRTFTPTQVLGMVLSNLKSIAEKNLNAAVVDCCIGIPIYFTDLQRRAVLDAATIADRPPENDQLNVAFVDIGHASMQVCIAGFKKGQLKILAHAFDRSLENARACLRLRAACEKLKKVLSANPEAPLNIECLMDEKDADMNASECVAKGCALECAILSPTFKVREFQVNESFPFPIALSWKGAAPDTENGGADNQQSIIVIPKGNPIPSIKATTFSRSGTFTIDVQYGDVSELQAPAKISTYTIGPFKPTKSERAKLKVKVRLNLHGIVFVESAMMLEEEEGEVPVAKEAAKMDTDEIQVTLLPRLLKLTLICKMPNSILQGQKMVSQIPGTSLFIWKQMLRQDVRYYLSSHSIDDYIPSPSAFTTSNLHGLQHDFTTAILGSKSSTRGVSGGSLGMSPGLHFWISLLQVEVPKKKVKKSNVPVSEFVYGGMAPADVQNAMEKEFEMALQDRIMEETKDKKNAVEAYVYDMRNKLHDKYQDFVIDSEREELTAKLQEVEDWLYEDGEDETKGVYIAKLEELKKQGDPIEERYKEHTERGSQQDMLPKHATPVILSADIRKKAEALDRFCRPIMTKPRPAKPATPETPSPATPQGSEPQSQGPSENDGDANNEVPPAAAEPMETEKSETEPGSA